MSPRPWLMLGWSQVNPNDIPVRAVFHQSLRMTAECYFVVEYDKPQKPKEIIKGPDGNTRPEVRLKFAFKDFDVTTVVRVLSREKSR